MDDAGNPSHTKWECKYQVVFTPKCRRRSSSNKSTESLTEMALSSAHQGA
jgi:hypothetical protein